MPDFKRIGGKIYAVKFTAKEQEAINREIRVQLTEDIKKNRREFDALLLLELRQRFGFGVKRLHELYMGFGHAINELLRRYEMNYDDDATWLAERKLRDELGIDLDEWEKERQAHDIST